MDGATEGPDWDHRQLCPDGGCVGVIGPDGSCKVCGRVVPGWGDERQRGLNVPDPAEILVAPEIPPPLDTREILASVPPTDGEWDDRRLCDDGGCVGVIGDDGRCTVCGKPPTA